MEEEMLDGDVMKEIDELECAPAAAKETSAQTIQRLYEELELAKDEGDDDKARGIRRELLVALASRSAKAGKKGSTNLQGHYAVKETPKKKEKPPKSKQPNISKSAAARPPKKPPETPGNLTPCMDDEIEGEFMRGQVLGYNGKTFCGRRVVVLRRTPHQFGCPSPLTIRVSEHTLVNGIVNHSKLTADGVPKAYWAVVDAACELKTGFTSKDVVRLAAERMRLFGAWKEESDRTRMEQLCLFMWEAAKNHQHYVRTRDAGAGYIVDKLNGKTMTTRARNEDETHQYFEAMRARKSDAAGAGKKARKASQPTESHPVVTVMGLPR
jgi:hypothetical protein